MISFLRPAATRSAGRSRPPESVADDLRIQPGYDHSYYFIASFIEDTCASMRSIY